MKIMSKEQVLENLDFKYKNISKNLYIVNDLEYVVLEHQEVHSEPENIRLQTQNKEITNMITRMVKGDIKAGGVLMVYNIDDIYGVALFNDSINDKYILSRKNASLKINKQECINAVDKCVTSSYKYYSTLMSKKHQVEYESEVQNMLVDDNEVEYVTNQGIENDNPDQINVRPESDIYTIFKNLRYDTWYAISEFVDNSTASYFVPENAKMLNKLRNFKSLDIRVNYDKESNTLSVVDNAFGMDLENFKRAVQLQKPPKDTSGRNEFGMGLKTSAFWFGEVLTVETTAYGSEDKYSLTIDTNLLKANKASTVNYKTSKTDKESHGTTIKIENIYEARKPVHPRTIKRIKDELSTIYTRDILGKNSHRPVNIYFNDSLLEAKKLNYYEAEDITVDRYQPYIKNSDRDDDLLIDSGTILFKDEEKINLEFTHLKKTYKLTGEIGILETGKASSAGFMLYRRGRVIHGGPGNNYKPKTIFGAPNSFMSQRIAGNIFMDNFEVSQSKDKFEWDAELESIVCDKIKDKIKDLLFLCTKIKKSDKIPANSNYDSTKLDEISDNLENTMGPKTFNEVEKNEIKGEQKVIDSIISKEISNGNVLTVDEAKLKLEEKNIYETSSKIIEFDGYKFKIQKTNSSDFLKIVLDEKDKKLITVCVNVEHDLFSGFLENKEFNTVIYKIAIAMAFAETTISNTEEKIFRQSFNYVLESWKDLYE